jgi:hypothetical protein
MINLPYNKVSLIKLKVKVKNFIINNTTFKVKNVQEKKSTVPKIRNI